MSYICPAGTIGIPVGTTTGTRARTSVSMAGCTGIPIRASTTASIPDRIPDAITTGTMACITVGTAAITSTGFQRTVSRDSRSG